MPVSKATIEQIARSMNAAEAKGKPFAVLLGAGASRSAGIPTASEMADELVERFYEEDEGQKPPDDPEELWQWAVQAEWYERTGRAWKDPEIEEGFRRYAACMARLDPALRREYLLECCQRASAPNWAHLFVAQLITEGYVDIVLTTNFDDLMRRALLLFPGKLPTMCEHAEAAHHVEIGMSCPQIVHLHGSAVYYDTCHTPDDVQKLPGKFGEVLRELLKNKGLLVVGYRGAEPGVMGALQEQLSFFAPPYRLYWVAHERKEDDLSKQAKRLLSLHPGEHLAMLGQGADKFFDRLCGPEGLRLPVPKFVEDPFAHGLAALKGVAEMPEAAGDETKGLVASARKRLEAASTQLAEDKAHRLFFEALKASRKGTLEGLKEACRKYKQVLAIKPDLHEALTNWGSALTRLGWLVAAEEPDAVGGYYEEAFKKYEQALAIKPDAYQALNSWGAALLSMARLETGEEREALLARAEELVGKAEEIEPGSGLYNLACVYAMQGREEEAFAKLREAIEQSKAPWSHVAQDPDWDDLRDHEAYQKLEAEFGGGS